MDMQLFRAPLIIGNVAAVGWLTVAFFYVWMVTDCLGNRALPVGWKVLWLLVMILLPIVGAVLYFLLAKGGRGSRPLV